MGYGKAVARACSGDDPSVRFNARNSVIRLTDRSNTALVCHGISRRRTTMALIANEGPENKKEKKNTQRFAASSHVSRPVLEGKEEA